MICREDCIQTGSYRIGRISIGRGPGGDSAGTGKQHELTDGVEGVGGIEKNSVLSEHKVSLVKLMLQS